MRIDGTVHCRYKVTVSKKSISKIQIFIKYIEIKQQSTFWITNNRDHVTYEVLTSVAEDSSLLECDTAVCLDCSILNDGIMVLQKVRNQSSDKTESHPKRLQSSAENIFILMALFQCEISTCTFSQCIKCFTIYGEHATAAITLPNCNKHNYPS